MRLDAEWKDSLANSLAAGDPLVGLILKMPAPASIELGGHLGIDFVIIDTEHGIGGGAELDNHLRAADSASTPVLVRVGAPTRTEIARALDGGAAGVVIPQVESAEAATEAVRLAHYPPAGTRGFATSTRAGGQGTVPMADHLAAARQNTVVVVQIESGQGAERVGEILSVDGVSAVWLGLSDLSLELGYAGQLDHPVVVDAVTRVIESARRADVPILVIADSALAGRLWTRRGVQVLLMNLLAVTAEGIRSLMTSHDGFQRENESRRVSSREAR